MIAGNTKTNIMASINLGWSSLLCCRSNTSRMQGAVGVYHTEGQSDSGPEGRSEHHEQTRY